MATTATPTATARRAPVTVVGVLDDAELAWRLRHENGAYAHVLMQREFAASLDALHDPAFSAAVADAYAGPLSTA
jgi:hypothetical protein